MAKQIIVTEKDYLSLVGSLQCSLADISFQDLKQRVERISKFLEEGCKKKVLDAKSKDQHADFYFLGSYARTEASLYSDIDMLLVGESAQLNDIKDEWHHQALPVRARSLRELPELHQMEETSLISLMYLKAFAEQEILSTNSDEFMDSFLENSKQAFIQRKEELVEALFTENQKRWRNYNSISNYLEPNLKYQPGGLRDLFQAHVLVENLKFWDEEKQELLEKIASYRYQLLFVRQVLHAKLRSDVLLASEQQYLAEFFGFANIPKFMTYIQKICDDSAFLCKWVFAVARMGQKKQERSIEDRFNEILDEPEKKKDIRYLKIIRDWVESDVFRPEMLFKAKFYPKLKQQISEKANGLEVFLYEAKILDSMLPDFRRVRHLVQHDQYHRYTVGAHTYAAIRNVLRLKEGLLRLSYFKELHQELSEEDWDILLYSALFHDLGKGYKKDHSVKGLEIVDKYLERFNSSKKLLKEVKWMVKNHLLFSKVAFRTNLSGAGIFRRLESEDLSPERIRNLSLFTLVDIHSSNPEALTKWKESLLFDLYTKLINPELRFGSQLEKELRLKYPEVPVEIWESLDVDLLALLGEGSVADLFSYWEEGSNKELFRVFATEVKNQFLLSYQRGSSEIGLLNSLLSYLVAAGFNILKVNATSSHLGVLDLFLVTDHRPAPLLSNLIKHFHFDPKDTLFLYPNSAKWRLMENGQWTVRSEGKNFKEILLGLTNQMFLRNLDVDWVNIYKWGRQTEVVLALSHGEVPPEEWQVKTWDL